MVNINLATEQVEYGKESSLKKQLSILVLIFLLLVGVHMGLILYKNKVRGNISALNGEYQAQSQKLTEADNFGIVDFQNRINSAQVLLSGKDKNLEILQKMEAIMVPGAYIKSYSYDSAKNTLNLIMVANNYNSVAKQILSFKNSNYFTEVSMGKSTVGEKGDIEFSVDLLTNNK